MEDPEGGVKGGCPDPPFKNYFDEKSNKIVRATLFAKIWGEKKLFDNLLIIMYFFWLANNWFFIGSLPFFKILDLPRSM